jgi:hypothetical protein
MAIINSYIAPIHMLHISSFRTSFPNSASLPSFKLSSSKPITIITTTKHNVVKYHRQRTRTRATLDDIEKDELSSTPFVVEDDKPKRVCFYALFLCFHFDLLLLFSNLCLVYYKIEVVKMLKFESLANPFHHLLSKLVNFVR